MTRITIILIFIICNCRLNAQTFKAIYGDTSVYSLIPCVDVPEATPRWECYSERLDLKNGFYTIYFKTDTTKLYETFHIKNKNMHGINKVYNEKGNLGLVRKWKNGKVKLDSSFYETGELASIEKMIIGNFAKPIYGYTKSYYENGKLLGENKVGLFRIIVKGFCENGKMNSFYKYRKRDNKTLINLEYSCE